MQSHSGTKVHGGKLSFTTILVAKCDFFSPVSEALFQVTSQENLVTAGIIARQIS